MDPTHVTSTGCGSCHVHLVVCERQKMMLAFLELIADPVLGSDSGGTLGGRSLGLAQPLPGL